MENSKERSCCVNHALEAAEHATTPSSRARKTRRTSTAAAETAATAAGTAATEAETAATVAETAATVAETAATAAGAMEKGITAEKGAARERATAAGENGGRGTTGASGEAAADASSSRHRRQSLMTSAAAAAASPASAAAASPASAAAASPASAAAASPASAAAAEANGKRAIGAARGAFDSMGMRLSSPSGSRVAAAPSSASSVAAAADTASSSSSLLSAAAADSASSSSSFSPAAAADSASSSFSPAAAADSSSSLSSSSLSPAAAAGSSSISFSSSSLPSAAAAGASAASCACEEEEGKKQQRLTRSQKKWQRRQEYREKKRAQRPQERRRRRREARERLLSSISHLPAEEQRVFLRQHREVQRQQREILLKQLQQRQAAGKGLQLCFNCSFDEQHTMNEKEVRSLAKQLFVSYHLVRRSPLLDVQLHFTSFSEDNSVYQACRDLFAFNGWIVHHSAQPFWEIFPREKVVVLSPDAEEELLDVEAEKVYVIGGLVDRTICRSESHRQAERLQMTCKKLPIKTFLPNQERVVLNVNAVVEILVHYWQHGDWRAALQAAMPRRLRGIGGRKKERMDKKRQRLATRRQLEEEDQEEAVTTAARQKRERTWCGGGARNSDFADSSFNPFDDNRALTGVAFLFKEEGKETGTTECLQKEGEVDSNEVHTREIEEQQRLEVHYTEEEANTKTDSNSGSSSGGVRHGDFQLPTAAASPVRQSTAVAKAHRDGSKDNDEGRTTHDIPSQNFVTKARSPATPAASFVGTASTSSAAIIPPVIMAAEQPRSSAVPPIGDLAGTSGPVNPLFQ